MGDIARPAAMNSLFCRLTRVPQECAILASRIVREVGAPYDIDGHEIIIGTSIGIALSDG